MQYADADLNFMFRIRSVFDPERLMNRAAAADAPGVRRGLRPQRPRLPEGAWVWSVTTAASAARWPHRR